MANDPPFSGVGNDLTLPITPATYVADIEDNFAKCKDEIIGLNTKIDNRTGPTATSYIEVQDEGVVVAQSPFSKLNFVGPNVSAVDFDDEQVDISISLGAIELWFPAVYDGHNNNNGDFQVGGPAGATRYITGFIPTDFVSLVSVELVYIKNNTDAIGFTFNSDYGTLGEISTTHSQTVIIGAAVRTTNFIYAQSLAAVLTLINAGDFFGIQIVPTNNCRLLGIRFIYMNV
jgi:hypothetical protein